jgi:2-polyprenyl-3-methyl-5-hydroxy-6-metoxy-1,4-benzoquinol methylase
LCLKQLIEKDDGMGVDCIKYTELPEDYHKNIRSEMYRYLPIDARTFLDVGCGEGGFGELIKKQREAEVWGIELFAQAATKAKVRLDQVCLGNIETDQLDLPDAYFDCIVFNDVLEHLYYPWDVLQKVKKLLRKNGYIVASIPNIRHYVQIKELIQKGEWEYGEQGLMDRTHIRFFTLNSIRKMFEESGYVVQKIEGIKYEKFPWKLALLNKLLGNRLDDMRFLQFACVVRV